MIQPRVSCPKSAGTRVKTCERFVIRFIVSITFQILLSVISILNEPNCSSPANVDASILYKKYRDASDKKKHQTAYAKIVLEQVRWNSYQNELIVEGAQIASSCGTRRDTSADQGRRLCCTRAKTLQLTASIVWQLSWRWRKWQQSSTFRYI